MKQIKYSYDINDYLIIDFEAKEITATGSGDAATLLTEIKKQHKTFNSIVDALEKECEFKRCETCNALMTEDDYHDECDFCRNLTAVDDFEQFGLEERLRFNLNN
jgi:hypothetical protein